jgi:hypothetical protein
MKLKFFVPPSRIIGHLVSIQMKAGIRVNSVAQNLLNKLIILIKLRNKIHSEK